jgi:FkbM family methyltransferase
MKQIIKKIINKYGFELKRRDASFPIVDSHSNVENMDGGLNRSKESGVVFNSIIDVGAAQGNWTRLAMKYWPDAQYVLIEPLQEREATLEAMIASSPNCHLVSCAAGSKQGNLSFYVADDLDGSLATPGTVTGQNVRQVPMTSIEAEIARLGLTGPFMVKLDTHGFEVPIIEGCLSIIDKVSLFIIECYGFQITKDSLLFWEMCEHMQRLGFRLVDVVDIMRRPGDNAFWQCDAFFIPSGDPVFTSNSYK